MHGCRKSILVLVIHFGEMAKDNAITQNTKMQPKVVKLILVHNLQLASYKL
jgi:hypothetical protein